MNVPRDTPRKGPLSGRLVVAIEHSVAGPLCTRILRELGADVIKIERPPHGDFSRQWDSNAKGEGAQFWWLNRGKQSIVLDLKSNHGREVLHQLLARADAFVQNLSPGSAARLGVGKTDLERWPNLVSCHISGYGFDGPLEARKAYDMLIQAESGVMSLTGTPDQPTRVGVSIADVATGIYGAVAVLGGLLGRQQDGVGAAIDIAMFDVATEFLGPMLVSYLNTGIEYTRSPDQHHAIAPYGVFRCSNGQVLIAIEHDDEWVRFCHTVIEQPKLAEDPAYATNLLRLVARDELIAHIEKVTCELERGVVVQRLEAAQLAYAMLNGVDGVANHPVAEHRGAIGLSRNSSGDEVQHVVGLIHRAFGGADGARTRPPNLGEDTQAVLDLLSGPATEGQLT